MSASEQPVRFGQISPPDEAWLARQPPESILDPDLPIIDPHHHLWDRPQHRYLLDEFLADVRTGHHLVATVFEECHSMYRTSRPEELRPVGETEFVAGVAAMSASGLYGPTRVAAGIVGFIDWLDTSCCDSAEGKTAIARIRQDTAEAGRNPGTVGLAGRTPRDLIWNRAVALCATRRCGPCCCHS